LCKYRSSLIRPISIVDQPQQRRNTGLFWRLDCDIGLKSSFFDELQIV
jgi:hypothetical protein